MLQNSLPLIVSIAMAAGACTAAGTKPAEPKDAGKASARKPPPSLEVAPVPDIDPVTGVDRRVTYEPQLAPDPQERDRKDPRKTAPQARD